MQGEWFKLNLWAKQFGDRDLLFRFLVQGSVNGLVLMAEGSLGRRSLSYPWQPKPVTMIALNPSKPKIVLPLDSAPIPRKPLFSTKYTGSQDLVP